MIACRATDFSTLSKRRIYDGTGFLSAPAVIGRTGIQTYRRGEIGLDGDPLAEVRLMRTADEVFAPETVASFENMPLTNNHPSGGVTKDNWRQLAVGEVRDVAKTEDGLLGSTVIVKDGAAIRLVIDGKTALSCGYSFDFDPTPGEGFDGYQRSIRGNHVAIVDVPRGGPACRVADNTERKTMSTRKIVVDGLPFELEEIAAAAIEKTIAKLTKDGADIAKEYADFLDSNKTVLAAKDAQLTAKDAEIAKLTTDLAAAKAIDTDALVAERVQVIEDAKKIAADLKPTGSSSDIRRAAIAVAVSNPTAKVVADAVFGQAGIEKATPDQIKTVFAALVALPSQAASNTQTAQDAAIGAAIGGNVSTGTDGGEVFHGAADYQ
jgi:uncharacterized protein